MPGCWSISACRLRLDRSCERRDTCSRDPSEARDPGAMPRSLPVLGMTALLTRERDGVRSASGALIHDCEPVCADRPGESADEGIGRLLKLNAPAADNESASHAGGELQAEDARWNVKRSTD